MLSLGEAPSSHLYLSTTPEALKPHGLRVFIETLLHRRNCLHHWTLAMNSIQSPVLLYSPELRDWG